MLLNQNNTDAVFKLLQYESPDTDREEEGEPRPRKRAEEEGQPVIDKFKCAVQLFIGSS